MTTVCAPAHHAARSDPTLTYLSRPLITAVLALAILVASAAIAWYVAPDRAAAVARFWLLAAGCGLTAACAGLRSPARLAVAMTLLALAGAALAIVFAATQDPLVEPVAFAPAAALGGAIASLSPAAGAGVIDPDIAAGTLGAIWPFAVAAAAHEAVAPRRIARAALFLIAFGLLLTAARSAWLASAVVAPGWIALKLAPRRLAAFGGLAGVAALVALAAVAVIGVLPAGTPMLPDAGASSGRLYVQSRALTLVRDYAFTGAGLAAFPAQYAAYADIAPVQASLHARQLYLNILVEQGVPGFAALMLLATATVAAGVRGLGNLPGFRRWAAEAALASQAVIVLHGLAEDPLYAGSALPVLFVPAGVALAAAAGVGAGATAAKRTTPGGALIAGVALGAAAIATVAGAPKLRAAFSANIGAVHQARAELGAFDEFRFSERTIDDVRREVDLDAAIARFRRAMELDPGQPTAARRLAAIALARGNYQDALALMEMSWAQGHDDPATRWLLSDALVATGSADVAVRLLDGQPGAAERLKSTALHRYWRRSDVQRAYQAWTAAARLDPDDEEARSMAEIAAQRLAGR